MDSSSGSASSVPTSESKKLVGGQLLAVTDNHHLLTARDRPKRVDGLDLAGLVENDQVESKRAGRKIIGDGKRTHHEHGLDRLDRVAGL